ncbi:MAG: sulfotransferase family protein [Planctomycetes bacterium]|nr:sulfotransferase family protein [Planctomycetota bacterium]
MGLGIMTWLKHQKRRMFRKTHVLYFCHIPKTCGTTFDRMIRSRFTRELAAPILDNQAYFTNPEYSLENYDFISGHLFFGKHIPELVSRPVRSVVLLREPRALLLSMFKHGIQFDQDPVHQYIKANCPTPDQFFRDPVMAPYVANPMARFLGISERKFAPEFIRKALALPLEKTKLLLASVPPSDVHDFTVLDTALRRLGEFHVVALAENLQSSINLVARMEDWPPFGQVPHYNESSNKTKVRDLSAETIRAIDKLTELDREIYRVGKDLFNQALVRERLDDEPTISLPVAGTAPVRKAA